MVAITRYEERYDWLWSEKRRIKLARPRVWYELRTYSPDGDFVCTSERITAREAAAAIWQCDGPITSVRLNAEDRRAAVQTLLHAGEAG